MDTRYVTQRGKKVADCRYGENAYMRNAALYSIESDDPLGLDKLKVIEGDLGYNNYCDIDRAIQSMTHIAAVYDKNWKGVPCVAIGLKHGNVCGADYHYGPEHKEQILMKMLEGDLISIFGGTVMVNFHITKDLAEVLRSHKMSKGKRVLDVIVAPSFDEDAIKVLSRKEEKCKIVELSGLASLSEKSLDSAPRFRYVRGGFLLQPNYTFVPLFRDAEKNETAGTYELDMALAWAICATSNSNTITLVKDAQLIANACSQQDRVGAVTLALAKAKRGEHEVYGSVCCSDSFFPFPDGPELLVDAKIKMLLTTTGSMRDDLMKDVCKDIILYTYPDSVARVFYAH